MGWTEFRSRRRIRRRHQPQLEHLDDRCLLATSAGINLTHHIALSALERRHALVGHAHEGRLAPGRNPQKEGHRVAKSTALERPAGSIEVGAATAYDPIIGAAAARAAYNVDGTGMTVAVIDTGVDYNNPALGGGFGPGHKVVAGYDFADGASNPLPTSSQHGTAIAGLIGSDDPNDLGVAPGVNIVALRVTDGSNTASLNSIAEALQWVINNHQQYNITAVNMSLADGGNYAQNWFANDGGAGQQVTDLVGQLTAMNIPVVAATGNSFNGMQGEGFAAIVAGTISVTATDLSGNLLSNAQRLGTAIGGASATTIAAPGEGLTAPSGDSGTATVEGTSFATALTTGAITLLQDIYQSRFGSLPTVAQIKSWLQQGSNPVNDPVTGITIGELNIPKTARLIPEPSQPSSPPSPAPSPTSVFTPAPTTPTPSVPNTPSAVSSTPAPTAPTVAATTPIVQVFVNGQQLSSSGSTLTGGSSSLDESPFEELLEEMSFWVASAQSGQGATQVQIWNA